MAKKTNNDIRDMSLNAITDYVQIHRSEGFRFANVCGETAAGCIKEAVAYNIERAIKSSTPINLQPE